MSAVTKTEILRLREEGKTYREIGEIYGLTRQRIHAIATANDCRVRKKNTDIEKIVYKGIYEFMKENPNVSFTKLASVANNGSALNNQRACVFIRKLSGTTDKVTFTISNIKCLMKFTGKSFDELFERKDLDAML